LRFSPSKLQPLLRTCKDISFYFIWSEFPPYDSSHKAKTDDVGFRGPFGPGSWVISAPKKSLFLTCRLCFPTCATCSFVDQQLALRIQYGNATLTKKEMKLLKRQINFGCAARIRNLPHLLHTHGFTTALSENTKYLYVKTFPHLQNRSKSNLNAAGTRIMSHASQGDRIGSKYWTVPHKFIREEGKHDRKLHSLRSCRHAGGSAHQGLLSHPC
jgi:hypothetical protein